MKLLLIEDYAVLRESLAQGLREEGYAVDVSADGKEGLWYARNETYDVIILDLMLPKLPGLELLKQYRDGGGKTPVLILSAKDRVGDRVVGLDGGGDDYLTKPFAFPELLSRIRALMRRRYDQPSPLIQIGPIRIDTTSQRVWREEEEIVLTAREYSLLEFLARRVNEVVTRTEIWEHLYDLNSDSTSNVVDVYIGYLRKKIDPPGDSSMIETLRGRGYRLKETP